MEESVCTAHFSFSVTFALVNKNTTTHSLSFSSKLLPRRQVTTGSDEAILFCNVMATSSFVHSSFKLFTFLFLSTNDLLFNITDFILYFTITYCSSSLVHAFQLSSTELTKTKNIQKNPQSLLDGFLVPGMEQYYQLF